ncbi:hypothetical protein B0H17DRAFT_1135928 [Mycena rosella]|uniref:Uncharacterized protein n=1 Tax=Mycena rosella TaxID=1033263 RepID=A0AAD7DBZ3_MYCRO|nr:hypothetical protein B0H17DRAFT_1135928 [Mycena rosella]
MAAASPVRMSVSVSGSAWDDFTLRAHSDSCNLLLAHWELSRSQLLAVQDQLKEPLNLNSDLLNDPLDGRVVHCPSGGDRGLDAMFTSILLPRRAEHSRVWDRALLKFKGNGGVKHVKHGYIVAMFDEDSMNASGHVGHNRRGEKNKGLQTSSSNNVKHENIATTVADNQKGQLNMEDPPKARRPSEV